LSVGADARGAVALSDVSFFGSSLSAVSWEPTLQQIEGEKLSALAYLWGSASNRDEAR
jgi:hypothetical protein